MRKTITLLMLLALMALAVPAQAAMYGSTIDFSTETILSYGGSQDVDSSSYSILDSGSTLYLFGNTWKAVALDLTVAANSVLTFDFMSTVQGEIHAVGLDTNLSMNPDVSIQFFGTQSGGMNQYYAPDIYSLGDGWSTYTFKLTDYLPVGTHTVYLLFVNDDDTSSVIGESYFSNVKVGAVPLPGALLLFGSGLLGLVGLRRVRK